MFAGKVKSPERACSTIFLMLPIFHRCISADEQGGTKTDLIS